jgi:hypothetical protein
LAGQIKLGKSGRSLKAEKTGRTLHHRAPMAYVVRRQANEGVGIDGRSLGNGTAFSAVAPPQRPVYDAHQSKIFESGISIMCPGSEYLDA